mgnify:FL=1|jgi:hypothetical protein
MPSLDYIYDLSEKLEAENMEYLILALRGGKKTDKVDVFMQINEKSSKKAIIHVLEQIALDLKQDIGDDSGPSDTGFPNDDFEF